MVAEHPQGRKAINIMGMTGSLLIVGNLVIAHAGVDRQSAGAAVIAYDYKTGREWPWQPCCRLQFTPTRYAWKDATDLALRCAGLVSYDTKGNELAADSAAKKT